MIIPRFAVITCNAFATAAQYVDLQASAEQCNKTIADKPIADHGICAANGAGPLRNRSITIFFFLDSLTIT